MKNFISYINNFTSEIFKYIIYLCLVEGLSMLRELHMPALCAALYDHSFHSLCGAGRYGATPHAPVIFSALCNDR